MDETEYTEQGDQLGLPPAAEFVGVADRLGTLEEGKDADFIVLDANPLDDIRNTRRIDRVILRGHEVDRDALRSRWAAACAVAGRGEP